MPPPSPTRHEPRPRPVRPPRALADALGPALDPLRQLDARRRALDVAAFVGLWVVGVALAAAGDGDSAGGWALRVAGVVAAGLALNAFVLLLHEGMHGLLSRRPAVNRWLSVALGAPLAVSFTGYRVLHTLHHDGLGTDDDPDDYHGYTDRPVLFWGMQMVRLTVGAVIYLAAIPIAAWRKGTAGERRQIAAEYAVLAAAWAAAVVWLPREVLVWGVLAPLPVVALLTQVRGLTQHGLTERHDALLASRTVRAHPAVAFLVLYENYHLEHHLFPEVPSYHLAALHRAAWPHMPRACVATSYLGFLAHFFRSALAMDEAPVGVVRAE